MSNKIISEIFLTSSEIEEKAWNQLFNHISNLNGKLKKWNFWIQIENNEVRYFVRTRKELPTVIGNLGDFLIKKVGEEETKLEAKKSFPYIVKRKEKNILDIFDNFEVKKGKNLILTKISVFAITLLLLLIPYISLFIKYKWKAFKKKSFI